MQAGINECKLKRHCLLLLYALYILHNGFHWTGKRSEAGNGEQASEQRPPGRVFRVRFVSSKPQEQRQGGGPQMPTEARPQEQRPEKQAIQGRKTAHTGPTRSRAGNYAINNHRPENGPFLLLWAGCVSGCR